MQGLYIHIPFCSQACYYCDFHFSTNISLKEEMVKAICREIELQKDYLKNKNLDTIYFGGGTPSLLEVKEIELILNSITKVFQVNPNAEITIEANPDDLKATKIANLKRIGFNRLSIGIQSFNNDHLQYLHRIHNSAEAESCVKTAQDSGFKNISIDLIYGIPSHGHDIWVSDLRSAISLNVQHISSYCLTIEPNTVFGRWLKKDKIKNVNEDFSASQFDILMQSMEENGYEHYEISNFSLPDFHSHHNSNYWLGGNYLGVGPAAHSFNGVSRQYNISNNSNYLRSIKENKIPAEKEVLTPVEKINEYLMTGIRTKWGCDIHSLTNIFGIELSHFEAILNPYKNQGYLDYENGVIRLTKKGKMIADKITSDLFIEERNNS